MGTWRGYLGDVGKFPEIKVRPETIEEKEWFEAAAAASKRSLNQWMLVAAAEKAERDGIEKPGSKPKRKG